VIVIVGDKPARNNLNSNIPFVGTKSYKILLNWIFKLNVDITDVALYNRSNLGIISYGSAQKFFDERLLCEPTKVVAVGNEASKFLKAHGIEHFKLPHPSGLNRKLNDKEWLAKELKNCKKYLENN
jgi:uracil-DNA glycosylase